MAAVVQFRQPCTGHGAIEPHMSGVAGGKLTSCRLDAAQPQLQAGPAVDMVAIACLDIVSQAGRHADLGCRSKGGWWALPVPQHGIICVVCIVLHCAALCLCVLTCNCL
jgi:hypothetical protein